MSSMQPGVGAVDDLVDRIRRRRRLGMVAVPGGQLLGDPVQPFVEQALRPRVQRREGADDPRLALGDDQVRVGDDEQGRADRGQAQAVEQGREAHCPCVTERRQMTRDGGGASAEEIEMKYRQTGRERSRGLGNLARAPGSPTASASRRTRPAPASTAPSSSASTSSTPPTFTAAAPPRRFLGEALAGRPRDILHPRHQALLSDDRHRPRPLRRADRKAARRVAEAPQDRLCRSLSMPPLRRGDAARGDDGRR